MVQLYAVDITEYRPQSQHTLVHGSIHSTQVGSKGLFGLDFYPIFGPKM
jgi:hypothetical protein